MAAPRGIVSIMAEWKPNSQIFITSLALGSLSDVLRRASECVEKELDVIEQMAPTLSIDDEPQVVYQADDAEVPDDFDPEAAADIPLAWIALTSRAVAYELVAIVEDRLNTLAEEPWSISEKGKIPQHLAEIVDDGIRSIFGMREAPVPEGWIEAMAQLKQVSQRPFEYRRELIERHYGFRFADLPKWAEFLELSEIVNSLKHRRGRKSWRRLRKADWRSNLLQCDEMDAPKAHQAIKDTGDLLFALEHAVEASTARKAKATAPPSSTD